MKLCQQQHCTATCTQEEAEERGRWRWREGKRDVAELPSHEDTAPELAPEHLIGGRT
jgi:hypothetical protein